MSFNNVVSLPLVDNVPAPIYKLAESLASQWAEKTIMPGIKQDYIMRKKYMTHVTANIIYESKLQGTKIDQEYLSGLEKRVDGITSTHYYEGVMNRPNKIIGQSASGINFRGIHPVDRDDNVRAKKVKARLKRKREMVEVTGGSDDEILAELKKIKSIIENK